MTSTALLDVLHGQAQVCAAMGAPFSGALITRAAQDAAAGGPAAGLFAPWRDAEAAQVLAAAAPLRWLGAAHDLALSGEAPALSAVWPGTGRSGDAEAAFGVLRAQMAARPERFAAFMSHEPQTNEVRRSACLLPGFLAMAAGGLPLITVELGASAGLNQWWDRYRYDFGPAGGWGAAASPVTIEAQWRGPPADLGAPVRVIARRACDRAPIRLADPVSARRLRAYVWADQLDRLARLDAAIALASSAGGEVERADAADFVRAHARPTPGAATVVYHSVFWQYLPEATREAIAAHLQAAGATASGAAPLAWLRMEPIPPSVVEFELRLTTWPGGESRRLARCHPHGAWIAWEG